MKQQTRCIALWSLLLATMTRAFNDGYGRCRTTHYPFQVAMRGRFLSSSSLPSPPPPPTTHCWSSTRNRQPAVFATTRLWAVPHQNSNNESTSSSSSATSKKSTNNNSKKKKPEGVYARPSAAIERGSGFFVPGLEGPKVRVVVGLVLLLLIGINNYESTMMKMMSNKNSSGGISFPSSPGNTLATGLAISFAILVLAQAAIEFVKEQRDDLILIGAGDDDDDDRKEPTGSPTRTAKTMTTLQQIWTIPPTDEEYKSKVEWAASSYLSLTPATDMLLLGPGKVVYSLGENTALLGSEKEVEACQAALETLSKSSSGRVSLPLTHPTAQAISTTGTIPRCIVLQRIGNTDSQLCWMLVSDQLLASFTKTDLRWLGRMAVFVEPSS